MLSDLSDDEVAELCDEDYQETIQSEARTRVDQAFSVYDEIMVGSDDDQARAKVADKILALSGFKEKQQQSQLPSSISEEVFKIALAGLGQLAGIAQASNGVNAILRNVTPARSDPRPQLPEIDTSPMNRKPTRDEADDNDDIINAIGGERYEIFERKSGID